VVKRWYQLAIMLVIVVLMSGATIALADSSDEIIFKDKNLEIAFGKFYECEPPFTKEKANELSKKKNFLWLSSSNISDLDGIQYFDNVIGMDLSENELTDLSLLTKMKNLNQIIMLENSVKGKELEHKLSETGKINKLESVQFGFNEISEIEFLNKIGDIENYSYISLPGNKISDISLLKKAVNCTDIDLSNNRIRDVSVLKNVRNLKKLILADNLITDVTPLKGLKNLEYWIDLQDNCIIDYKPIKPIIDKVYKDGGWDGVISRYDYYTNPVDIGVNGKTVKFPYLTAYYKYQAYVEAVPLFKALGGSAKYDKKTETLTCEYNGNILVIKDFSDSYTLNGKKMSMKYPMRRMQYDLAYIPVKDICKAFGLSYKVTKQRKLSEREDEYFYAPKYIKISTDIEELG